MSAFTERLSTLLHEAGCDPIHDDLAFVERCASVVSPAERKAMTRGYLSKWLDALQSVPSDHRAQNAGRFAANYWLLGRMKARGLKIPAKI